MDKIILKNSAWLWVAQAITKAISFFYTIFLARNLGVENFGLYIAALSYFALISSVTDFGVARFLMREVSSDQSRLNKVLPIAIFSRFCLLLIFLVVFSVGLYVFDHDINRRTLSILAVLAVLPQSISLTLDAVFIALRKISYSALGILLLNIVTTTIGVIFVSFGYGSYGVVLALAIGQVLYAAILVGFTFWQKINWSNHIDIGGFKSLIRGSLPYGLLGILGLLYFKIDALMISYMRGNFELGIYGAGYKFLEAITFIPAVVGTVLFPVMAHLHERSRKDIYTLYSKSLKTMFLLSLPITLGFIFLLPPVINFFLPQYYQSITVIKVLALTIPWLFLIAPQGTLLLSSEKYLKPVVLISVFNLLFNFVGNLIFIPIFGFMGAAWMTVISDVVGFFIFYVAIKKFFS